VIEVGVREDDRRRLAAELERDALEIAGSCLNDELADFRRPGEGDLVDIGMIGERRACGLAEAGDDVDDAVGYAGFRDQFAEAERREGRLLGGLENDGAASGERRRELPRRHHEREVPRDDLSDHADRLAQRISVPIAGARHRNGFASEARRPSGHIAEHVDRAADVVPARIGDRLAVVERLDLGEFVGVLFEEVAELPHELRAVAGRNARPLAGFERLSRRRDRGVDVRLVARRHVGDDLLCRRVLDLEGLAALGLDPFAVNQHVMLLGEKRLRVLAELRFGNGDVHEVLPR
jgi:hypothetical protein